MCVSRVYLYSAYVGGLFIDILRVWIDTNSSSQPELLMAPKKSKAKVKPEDNEGKDDRFRVVMGFWLVQTGSD